jgi:hypothetical protein
LDSLKNWDDKQGIILIWPNAIIIIFEGTLLACEWVTLVRPTIKDL